MVYYKKLILLAWIVNYDEMRCYYDYCYDSDWDGYVYFRGWFFELDSLFL